MPRPSLNWKGLKELLLAPALAVLIAVSVGVFLHSFTFGSGLVNLSYDLLLVARDAAIHLGLLYPTTANEAVVIYMDEEAHKELNQPVGGRWDRALHAQLISRLSEAKAKVIVFDIVFNEPDPDKAEADRKLADAIKSSGRVVLAADHVPLEHELEGRFLMPIDPFRDGAAGVGSAELVPSRDLIIRNQPPNDPLPSLSWAAAAFLKARVTQERQPETFQGWINYYGQANSRLHVRYSQALDRTVVPDSFFRDKAVFVGARIVTKFAGDRKDEYRTPHSFWLQEGSRSVFIAGVEIQATAFLNLLRGDWLRRLSPATERWLIILVGVLAGWGLTVCRPWLATFVAFLGVLLISLGSYTLFCDKLIWSAWLIPVLQVALAWLFSIVFNSIQLYVENRLFEQTLERYLSPKLVKKFARSQDRSLLKPGAEKQLLTIIFTDIANFTTISEGMDSDDLAKVMNNYFETAVSNCIHKTDGTVVKYIGDAIFAFWNAPEQQQDHAERACRAALQLRHHVFTFSKGETHFTLRTRIGLHTGVATVGNFGSSARFDYTALGENINLASRMEGLNKHLGTTILLTRETNDVMGDKFITRMVGHFRLKGFDRTVEVYELLGETDKADSTQAWREAFNHALGQFQKMKLQAAEAGFHAALELNPSDGPSHFYLERIEEFRVHPAPADWRGEIELKEK